MTIHDALVEIRKVGTIRAENGKLKLRFPEPERARLELPIETLRRNRDAALRALSILPDAAPPEPADPDQGLVWMDWAEWRAALLNKLFAEQGKTGVTGKIQPATVKHGMKAGAR